jgi:hypothetical protein
MEKPQTPLLASAMRKLVTANLLYPFVLVTACYATWVAGWRELGHWPRPGFDDPAQVHGLLAVFDYATAFLFTVGFVAVWISHAVAGVLISVRPKRRARGVVLFEVLALVSLCLLFLFVAWDPQRVIEWYFD